jgi:uncharacterized protein
MNTLKNNYGPWAVIAGASQGIGEAFAEECAAAGLHLLLIARGEERLRELARKIAEDYSVKTRVLPLNLSGEDILNSVEQAVSDLDIGLLIYNATFPAPGSFEKTSLSDHIMLLNTNCRGQAMLIHCFLKRFLARSGENRPSEKGRRSGIILMSSLGGFQGSPYLAHYGASKAYTLALGEGLWYEYRERGIDVLTCCPGAVDTPNFRESLNGAPPPAFLPVLSPRRVARETLRGLGRKPLIVPGGIQKAAAFLMRRLLGRKTAVKLFGKETERLYRRR